MATAAAPGSSTAGTRSREVRIGLVLYGGVSLAIYIYGVVFELWRAVRASRGFEQNEYTAILDAIDADVTVDIVSGTSAGGINGVLLAKALATGADLGVVRRLWVEEGDFLKLIRDAGERSPASLLRSDRFLELVAAGLDDMDLAGDGRPLMDAVDLFVPATRLRPWVRRFRDSSGLVLETLDHRKVFQLKRRTSGFLQDVPRIGYDRNDFTREQNGRLAEVARATAAFPFAFEPQLVGADGADDPRFVPGEPRSSFFADGGILDNKPFTQTIDTIFARAAERPVTRWLISVEPDPKPPKGQSEPGPEPEVIEVVAQALVGIPRYESIAGDLEALARHQRRTEALDALLRRIDRVLAEQGPTEAAPERHPLWDVYVAERRAALVDELTARLLACSGLDETARIPVEQAVRSRLEPGGEVDFAFERRRLYHLLGTFGRAVAGPSAADGDDIVREARRRLWEAWDGIEDALWRGFGADSPAASSLRGLEQASGAAVYDAVRRALPEALAPVDAAAAEAATAAGWIAVAGEQALGGVDLGDGATLPLSVVAARYELYDLALLVLERTGPGIARDPILFRHITPTAATYVRKGKEEKLAGDALGHFGGFVKRSWRDNDILWGRLDAAEIVVRTLVREADTGRTMDHWIRSVQEPIAREEVAELQVAPERDYRTYLEREYAVGAESLADVAIEDRADLVLRSSDVLRNMFRRLGAADYGAQSRTRGLQAVFRWTGRAIGSLLFLTRWPVRAIWARDVALRRALTLLLAAGFAWALVTVVLTLLGLIPVEVLRGRLGVYAALAAALYLVYLVLLAVAARSRARFRRRRAAALQRPGREAAADDERGLQSAAEAEGGRTTLGNP